MEAEPRPDGCARLLVSASELNYLITFLIHAIDGLRNKRDEFLARTRVTFEEAESLEEELVLVRYHVLGVLRQGDPAADRLQEMTGPRRPGTAWDWLPRIEAEKLPGGGPALTLRREELSMFANCVDVALEELAPARSDIDNSEFFTRTGKHGQESRGGRGVPG